MAGILPEIPKHRERDDIVDAAIERVIALKVPTVDDYRGLSMKDINQMLYRDVYDEVGRDVAGPNRSKFAAEYKHWAADVVNKRFDDQPIAVIKTGEGAKDYLYDYVSYGPNPNARIDTPLYAGNQITDKMYGQPQWMRDLVQDLNSRNPRLPWDTLIVHHQSGSRDYTLKSPALQDKPARHR